MAQSHITSGTSGAGQEIYTQTAVDVEYSGNCWASHFYWSGVRKGDIFANLLPIGTMAATLSLMQGMIQLGTNPFHLAIFDSKSKLNTYLKKFPPNYIFTVPAYLTRLTVLCEDLGINPRRDFPDLKGNRRSPG